MPTVENDTGSAMEQPTGSTGREPPGLGLSAPDEDLHTGYDERELIDGVGEPLEQYVQHHPMKSVVVAACIGALFGMLVLRR